MDSSKGFRIEGRILISIQLTACINEGLIPMPFGSDVPAIDIAMKKGQRVRPRGGECQENGEECAAWTFLTEKV